MNHHRRLRIRTAIRGLGITLLLWAVLAALAEWLGAHWPHDQVNVPSCFDKALLPHGPNAIITGAGIAAAFDIHRCTIDTASNQWQNLILLAVVVEFLWLKSWMMAANTNVWDRLGTSLIAANLAFSIIYVYAMAVTLFPDWTGAKDFRFPLRYGLIAILAFGMVQLLLVPDADDDPDPDRLEVVPSPTSWDRAAAAAERLAAATEVIAEQGLITRSVREQAG